jgi:hypothetical protein
MLSVAPSASSPTSIQPLLANAATSGTTFCAAAGADSAAATVMRWANLGLNNARPSKARALAEGEGSGNQPSAPPRAGRNPDRNYHVPPMDEPGAAALLCRPERSAS